MKIRFSMFILLLALTGTSSAYDTSGNYAVWGAGKKSCSAYRQDLAKDEISNYKNYMKGFITAYNIFTEKTYSISGNMNENQIVEWITDYCNDNPMTSFEGALTDFIIDHHESRMKSASSTGGGTAW